MPLPSMYDPEAVKPMWQELADVGVRSLKTTEDVDNALSQPGTTLVVINSVCGCAAGGARPGVAIGLQHKKIPDHLVTVFAGVDRDAVDRVRANMAGIQPSSPCIALFKDGQPIHVLERRHIERMDANMIGQHLAEVFDQTCVKPGPSIPPEQFAKLSYVKICGSHVPRMSF